MRTDKSGQALRLPAQETSHEFELITVLKPFRVSKPQFEQTFEAEEAWCAFECRARPFDGPSLAITIGPSFEYGKKQIGRALRFELRLDRGDALIEQAQGRMRRDPVPGAQREPAGLFEPQPVPDRQRRLRLPLRHGELTSHQRDARMTG